MSEYGMTAASKERRYAHRVREFFVFAVLPFLVFAIFALHRGDVPLLTNDSPSYMYFGEDRPIGYPAFLWLVHGIFQSYEAVRYCQLALLCTALGLLAYSFRLRDGPLRLSLLVELALFANPGLLLLSDQIMAEYLSAACRALFAAATVALWRGARLWLVWVLIALAAVSPLVRPVNIALAPAAFLTLLLFGCRLAVPRWAQVGLLLAALLAAQQATPLIHALRHDRVATTNPAARGLFQKTLFRQWPADAVSDRCDGALIARDTAESNVWLAHAPAGMESDLERLYSGYLRFMVIIPEIVERHHFQSAGQADPILECYTLHRIEQDPAYFARDAARQFTGLLTYSTFLSQTQHDAIEQYLAVNPPPLPTPVARHDRDFQLRARALADAKLDPSVFAGTDTRFSASKARPRLLRLGLIAVQMAAAAAMLAGGVALVLALVRRREGDALVVAGLLGIAFYGEMLITAVIEIALPRYVLPLWPLVCAALLLAFLSVWGQERRAETLSSAGDGLRWSR